MIRKWRKFRDKRGSGWKNKENLKRRGRVEESGMVKSEEGNEKNENDKER